jgi:dolichol-phosphate mannosyltransferase
MRLVKPPVEVSVIVPTLNEAENLPRLVQLVADALADRSFEIILVDDDSRDNTLAVCEVLAERYPLRLIDRPHPRHGLSGAVIRGMEAAGGEYLVVMDADLQHPPEKIPQLLDELQNAWADMAIGSRYIDGGGTESDWGIWRQINSRVATLLAKPVACGIRDPMSGFFALRNNTFQSARRLNPTGYKIGLELLCKCGVKRVAEVPIHFGRRELGQSKLSARQQWRFMVHLSRLYQFRYPKSGLLAKLGAFALAGAGFAAMTNPAMLTLLAAWTAAAFGYATRSNRPTTSHWNPVAADREISLRTHSTPAEPIELAA